jgi:hypothetical protein
MKLVIQTQYRENYGAHDWDGEGACPQYWKPKGGSTYIVELDLNSAQNPSVYEDVEKCIEFSDDYSEEYILDLQLVDDVDFDVTHHIEEWETPIYATIVENGLSCLRDTKNFEGEVVATRRWVQNGNQTFDAQYIEVA